MAELSSLYITAFNKYLIQYFKVRERDAYYYRHMTWQNMKIYCVQSLQAERPTSPASATATAPASATAQAK